MDEAKTLFGKQRDRKIVMGMGTDAGGWIPPQVLECRDDGTATALEDYSSRELNVEPGEILKAAMERNGWMWCISEKCGESGWVPSNKLRYYRNRGQAI